MTWHTCHHRGGGSASSCAGTRNVWSASPLNNKSYNPMKDNTMQWKSYIIYKVPGTDTPLLMAVSSWSCTGVNGCWTVWMASSTILLSNFRKLDICSEPGLKSSHDIWMINFRILGGNYLEKWGRLQSWRAGAGELALAGGPEKLHKMASGC